MNAYEEKLGKLKEIIDEGNAVFFGGAGVSTESGIPDFRSQDGLYNEEYAYPPETIISHKFFLENTAEFYRFYKRKMLFPAATPNACHLALAKLEKEKKLKAVITQNIDGLHQKAGSKNVFELHGSVSFCACGGVVKPDVVLYGEMLDDGVVTGAVNAIASADTLIVGGTSLVVYPAAGLLRYFRGRHLVVINKTPTQADAGAELVVAEKLGKVFSDLHI